MGRSSEIAVAISTRDRPDALARCLDGVRAGRVVPSHIVVVDQSGDGRSRAVVEERQAGGVPIVYVSQEAVGLAASQNLAIASADAGIVAVIDDDCIPDPDWLEAVERGFDSPERPGLVTGRVLPLPAEGKRRFPVSSRTLNSRVVFRGKDLPWPVGSGNNFAVRRDVFLGIGGCDERLGPGSPGKGGVDMDLFYRLLRSGCVAVFDPLAVVRHERQTLEGRVSRRSMYGHGMGACGVLWIRERDWFGINMLLRWVLFRTRLMLGALIRGRFQGAYEEALVLMGTARGLLYGAGASADSGAGRAGRSLAASE